jgi:ribonuclease D
MDMINEGQTLVVNLSPKLDGTTTQQLSQELNSIAKEIETLSIKDKSLQTFQKNSTKQFKDLSNSLKQIAESLTIAEKVPVTPEGKKQLLEAQKNVEENGQKAKQIATNNEALLKELVNYCPSKKP